MMLNLNVKTDISRALEKLDRVGRDVRDKATVRALNKIAAQAKTRASREIRSAGYNIRASSIKAAIAIKRASAGQLVAQVRAVGRPIPLIEFDARQDRNGRVTVKVKGGRKALADAFISVMPGGHQGVFSRVGDRHKKVIRNGKAMWSGLPIKERFGPSVPAAFASEVVQAQLEALVREKFPDVFKHEVAYLTR